ncbi:phosphatidylglycerophosphatase A family protein [Flavimaricola marinus]|nr:phosphatidylglycerophosphatase A [Flavimaricola marinus]
MNLIATFGGVGNLRPAPGTWGSFAALPVALVLIWIGGPWLLVLGIVVVCAFGYVAAKAEIAATGDTDPSHVVIDEVAGQWIALAPVAFGAGIMTVPVTALWPGWLGAFVLFRLFDILKPGLIGRADRRGDALGLMLDDVIAGVFAALGVVLLAGVAHGAMRLF